MVRRLLSLTVFALIATSAAAGEADLPIIVLDRAPVRTVAPSPGGAAPVSGDRLVHWCHTRVVDTYGRMRNIGGS